MIQKSIRPYGGTQFTVAEGAELIEELNDRTASDQAGYNSTDEIATKMKLVETNKQDKLVSGTNIKTVNGNSLLGSGNISTTSGFQGTIVIADTPTTDGIYRPTEEGTYINAGGLTYLPSTTDEGFQVEFVLNGGIWSKSRVEVASDGKVTAWVAGSFENGTQRSRLGKLWESNAAVVSADIPGVSNKWVEIIGSDLTLYAKKSEVIPKNEKILTVNIFDKTKVTAGFYVNRNNGVVLADASKSVSDFIPIIGGEVYNTETYGNVAFYDINKIYISGLITSKDFTSPINATFFRFDMTNANVATQMVALKSVYPLFYTPFLTGYDIPQLIYDKNKVEPLFFNDKSLRREYNVGYRNLNYAERISINLFNKDDKNHLKDTGLFFYNGTTTPDVTKITTDFIPTVPGYTISSTYQFRIVFYNEYKQYISGINGASQSTFTMPPLTAYYRYEVLKDLLDVTMVVEGSVLPTVYQKYDIYRYDESSFKSKKESKYLGKKWNVLGDSITNQATYSYWRFLRTELNFKTVMNYGIGGTSIAVRAEPYDTNAMCLRYVDMDDDADLITVFGGTNDYSSADVLLGTMSDTVNTTFYGALKILCAGLVAKYPTKKIAFIKPISRFDMLTTNSKGVPFREYISAMDEVCGFYGIPCLDMSSMLPFRAYDETNASLYYRDTGLHPNELGHRKIADAMKEFFINLA